MIEKYDKVKKREGYKFPGIVIEVVTKLDGSMIYVVECVAPGAEGMVHIFKAQQLMPRTELYDGR